MYNETLYNVLIAPYIEAKIFKKSNAFKNWILIGIVFLIIDTVYFIYGHVINSHTKEWLNTPFSLIVSVFIISGLYITLYNPLRKQHVSLQIYCYLLFLDYFYFNNERYPNGLKSKFQYVIIVQSCIDSIDKYIKVMETYLISGENTIARIKYIRALRNVLYKIKGKKCFLTNITSFREILNGYYSGIHTGIKSILEFNENVEYLDDSTYDSKINKCMDMLSIKNRDEINNSKSIDNRPIIRSKQRLKLIIIVTISSILILLKIFIPDELFTSISAIVGVIGAAIGVIEFAMKSIKN